MDTPSGQPPAAVMQALKEKPRTFSFIQAVRLLILANRHLWRDDEDFLRHGLKICPDLSLAHPGTDLVDLKELPPQAGDTDAPAVDGQGGARPRFAMTVTFLSLYGASSPLPAFYTEELIEEAREDRDESRRFIDIFNQALHVLYYRAFNAYRLGQRTLEEGDGRLADLQHALAGMGLAGLRRQAGLGMADLASLDLWTRHARSAAGLASHVRRLTGIARVEVGQCCLRRVRIADDQRARLGRLRLGQDVIGSSVADIEGSFRLHLHDLDRTALERFLPGSPALQLLARAIRRFLNAPLSWDLVLHAAPGATRQAALGRCALGSTAFLCEAGQTPGRAYRFAAPVPQAG